MENEKSIEQIAMEAYAKKKLDERYQNVTITVGIVVGILSTIYFIFAEINRAYSLSDYADLALCAILLFALTFIIGMACVIMFSSNPKRNERKIGKIISLLSKEKSKKIISEYIQESIKNCENNIPHCDQKIEKSQREISELFESIESSKQRIPKLQEKLSNLKNKKS